MFHTITVVGVGLIGGSVALAAKANRLSRWIIGVGRNATRLQQALDAGVIDECETDLRRAAEQSDLILFATPVDQIVSGVQVAVSVGQPQAIFTDVGSTKGRICRELESASLGNANFIGSHPLAGSEQRGWEHARADLFDGRVCVVTPTNSTRSDTLNRLSAFWQNLGMKVLKCSPEDHDQAVAQSSHLPHVVASALARTLSTENRQLAATGFADTTRIAAGDPDVWVPILLDNAAAVLNSLDSYTAELNAFRNALSNRDAPMLRTLWQQGKATRDAIQVRKNTEDA